ncbi:aminotransferase DegT, partial [Candidatus Parcubacteria bacterium]
QPAFSGMGYKEGSMPAAERAAKRVMSLPMHPYLQEHEMQRIVEQVRTALQVAE